MKSLVTNFWKICKLDSIQKRKILMLNKFKYEEDNKSIECRGIFPLFELKERSL